TPYITIITRCSSCIEPQSFIFFFNDTATTEIYTLSLHDALPIFSGEIEVRVSDDSRQVIGKSPQAFDYQRKMVVSTVVGYRNDRDRKSTRLNSSHVKISYAVFCLKKKKNFTIIVLKRL